MITDSVVSEWEYVIAWREGEGDKPLDIQEKITPLCNWDNSQSMVW